MTMVHSTTDNSPPLLVNCADGPDGRRGPVVDPNEPVGTGHGPDEDGTMAHGEQSPSEAIALDIARCDMHYTATSIISLPPSSVAAETALLQYAVMSAFEARVYLARATGRDLLSEWDAGTAQSARTSMKFFADTKRNLDGVVAHFDSLLAANHQAFYPPARRARFLDFLRDDLSVVTRDGRPYTSLVSAHYLTGLRPDEVADLDTVGPALFRLSTGVGNVAGQLLADSGIAWHGPAPVADLAWFDGRATAALPRLFGGELHLALAGALMTVQSIVACAAHSASRSFCGSCEQAARKHRFITLFQSLNALTILSNSPTQLSPDMHSLLRDPDSIWILNQSRLRNGLVHLGLQDIASDLPVGSTVEDAVRAYSGDQPDVVADRVSSHRSDGNSGNTPAYKASLADLENLPRGRRRQTPAAGGSIVRLVLVHVAHCREG